jgi:uncharacterized protein YndB with AHSA1/START domain
MDAKPVFVTVTRRFPNAAEDVFDAFLDPALIGRWMFGPALRDEEVLRIAIDPVVGGLFSFLVRRQDQEIDHIGKYLEIERPRRLVFTWAIAPASIEPGAAGRVTIEIVPQGAGCELTLTHEMLAAWADYAPRVFEGWSKMLDALRGTLAAA